MKKLLNTVYITTPDRYISLDGENLVISVGGDEIGRVPLHNIERIITFGHAGASPALMGKCVRSGIELVFMSRNGHFLARVEGETSGNVLLRRKQYRMADDPTECIKIARNMVAAKLFNSRQTLERAVRDHSPRLDTAEFAKCCGFLRSSTEKARSANDLDSLRGIEGEGASVYFSVFDDMILQQKDDFQFTIRSRRPPLDRVNAMLSFAYSLATSMCTSALEAVGLDAYVGFMHTDRPGRRSLALDFIEEFRSPMCDRFVLTIINKRLINTDDFDIREDGAVMLNEKGCRSFIDAWQKRKYDEIKHPFLGEKVEWGMMPYVQALLLSRYIRGDIDGYPPFMQR